MDRYKVLELLGEGGFATVFHAYDQHLDRDVALKIVKPIRNERINLGRFEREAKLLSQLKHKNVILVLSYHGEDSVAAPFIVMEFLRGRTLRSLLQEKGKLESHFAKQVIIQICSGLSYAHKLGLVHRDLSAANVFLQDDKSETTVKIIDFGLSRLFAGDLAPLKTLTETGMLVGNPHYMSPEAVRGQEQDNRSDIYSLGCILYECLVGTSVVSSDTPAHLLFFHEKGYPPAPMIDPADATAKLLSAVCLRCLQKDKERRFQDCDEIIAILKNPDAGDTMLFSPSMDGWNAQKPQVGKRSRSVSLLLALFATMLIAATFSFLALDRELTFIPKLLLALPFLDQNLEAQLADALRTKGRLIAAQTLLEDVSSKFASSGKRLDAIRCLAQVCNILLQDSNEPAFLATARKTVGLIKEESDGTKVVQAIKDVWPILLKAKSQFSADKEILELQTDCFGMLLDHRNNAGRAFVHSCFNSILVSATTGRSVQVIRAPVRLADHVINYLTFAKPKLSQSERGLLDKYCFVAGNEISVELKVWKARIDLAPVTGESVSYLKHQMSLRVGDPLEKRRYAREAYAYIQKNTQADSGTVKGVLLHLARLELEDGHYGQAISLCDRAEEVADDRGDTIEIMSVQIEALSKSKQDSLAKELSSSVFSELKADCNVKSSSSNEMDFVLPDDFLEGEAGMDRFSAWTNFISTLIRSDQDALAKTLMEKLSACFKAEDLAPNPWQIAALEKMKLLKPSPDIISMIDDLLSRKRG